MSEQDTVNAESCDDLDSDSDQANEDAQVEGAGSDNNGSLDIESLSQQLEAAQNKAQENWDLLLRSRAEMDNLQKRASRDLENAHKFALDKIANELLAVRDSMELGLSAAEAEQVDVDSLKEGVDLTLKMLAQVMEKFNIKQTNPQNEKFDPDLHQAMSMQESEELAPNTVISVMQKGYTLNDRLLRPALVIVSKAVQSKEG